MQKKTIYKTITLFLILSIGVFSYFYFDKKQDDIFESNQKFKNHNEIIVISKPNGKNVYLNFDTVIFNQMNRLDSKNASYFAYSIANENAYLYFLNPKTKQVGLSNFDGKIIIPASFDDILTPNLTVEGYIEVRKNKKYNLYNLFTGKCINQSFEYIIPSLTSDYISFGFDGKKYLGIDKDLNVKNLDENFEIAGIGEILKEKSFATDSNSVVFIIKPKVKIENFNENTIKGFVSIKHPSYIKKIGNYELKYMLNVQPLNHFKYKETEYGYVGHEASEFSITSETKTFFNKFKVSLLKFWSYYISLRNYENIDGKVLIEENGKQKDIKTLFHYETYEGPSCDVGSMKFVKGQNNATLIQAISQKGSPDIDDMFKPRKEELLRYEYYAFSDFNYFKIDSIGKLKQLKTNRFFQFTKFTKIDDELVKSICLFGGEIIDSTIASDNNLRKEDIDLIINEIYADYGLIFNDEKYSKIFKNEVWYKPTLTNVDHLLTEIDKHNIQFLNQYKSTLKSDNE